MNTIRTVLVRGGSGLRLSWRALRVYLRATRWSIYILLFAFLIRYSTYPTYLQWNAVALMVGSRSFNWVSWEVDALAAKAGQTLWGEQPFMDEEARSQYVRDYMADLATAQQLEAQIDTLYGDPTVRDAYAASADLRAERDALRDDLSDRQTLVESILEGQIAAVLVDQGFGAAGQLLPPIAMRFSQAPNLLIVSPRDAIRFDISMTLDPMAVEERGALEQRIESSLDVSSLIVPLGGVAVYPALILETSSLQWAIETFSHEWSHLYLFFYPLGYTYTYTGEARIINETVADTFGGQIGRLVLARYYPDLLPPEPPDLTVPEPTPILPTEPPVFDFGAAMNETRTTVDDIMAQIQIVEAKADVMLSQRRLPRATLYGTLSDRLVVMAESYMERRRLYFHDNGYNIRRLNQAYFAFYGGYQGGIAGIGGEDPIGPAVRDILAMSPSIHDWITTMRGITTRDELVAVRDAMEAVDRQADDE